ncbi:unnamed protein product [Prunus brigantina]
MRVAPSSSAEIKRLVNSMQEVRDILLKSLPELPKTRDMPYKKVAEKQEAIEEQVADEVAMEEDNAKSGLAYNKGKACRLCAYVEDITLEKGSIEFVLENFSEHKVSRLKLSDLSLLIVVRPQLLLVGCNSNNGLFSFFFEQIKVDFHLLPVLVKTAHLNAYEKECDDSLQLVDLFSFCAFQSFLQAVQHDLVGCLCLAITMRVSGSWQVLFDAILRKECGDLPAHKLSHQVNGPLHEWPWTVLRMVFLSWQARNQLIALASITSSGILRGVLSHGSSSICIKSDCSASSLLSWSRCSIGMKRLNWVSSADPKLASASACSFSARGTYWMVKVGNAFNSSWTLSRYKIILGCFTTYSPEA